MKSENGNSVTHKDVIIVGNGPSGIALSYMLAGNLPYVISNDHPDEMLSARLALTVGEDLVHQDLEFLSSGLEGRSTNPVSLLLDSLIHPCADIGLEIDPLIEWRKDGTEIDHIVFGKGPPGGSWHAMDPHILTLSLGTWMALPGFKYTTRDTAEKRAFAHNVAKYYEQYVTETNLTKYFANGTIVTNITELESAQEAMDTEENNEEVNKTVVQMEDAQKELIVKQSNCPLTNALNYLLSRGPKRLKMDRCCKRKLDYENKNKETGSNALKDSSLNGGDVASDISFQRNRFKKMNLNCDKNRSVSFSCDYDNLKRSNGSSIFGTSFSCEQGTLFSFLRNLDTDRLFKKVPEEKSYLLPNPKKDCDPTTSDVRVEKRKDAKPRWMIEVYDIKTKTLNNYTCNSLVLANGASDLPNRLNVSNEKRDPSWLLHDVRSLEIELDLHMQQNEGTPDPVLIVGAGLSAADAIIAARGKNVPVLHVFRNKSRDLNKQLPENMYPEYHKVHQMMQSSSPYSLYTALPEHSLSDYSDEKRTVTLTSSDGKEIQYQVSFAVVLIGSRPDLSFLPRNFNIGVNQTMTVDSKTNPINIDKIRHSVRGYKELYAMGPIAGDKFVRFLPGGALAIVADLYKKYEY